MFDWLKNEPTVEKIDEVVTNVREECPLFGEAYGQSRAHTYVACTNTEEIYFPPDIGKEIMAHYEREDEVRVAGRKKINPSSIIGPEKVTIVAEISFDGDPSYRVINSYIPSTKRKKLHDICAEPIKKG